MSAIEMTEDEFWRVIDESRSVIDPQLRDGNMDNRAVRLKQLLSAMPDGQVQEFQRIYADLLGRAYRWDLWGAADVIGNGCSDDGFTDFRKWLISMGRTVFEGALADPDSLVTAARAPGVEVCSFEEFGYVAADVLEERGCDEPSSNEPPVWPPDPAGERWTDESLPQRYPKLWAAFQSRGGVR